MTEQAEPAAPPAVAGGQPRIMVGDLGAWIRAFARLVREHRDELTALDAAIGDADHGTNLDRGMTAVIARLDSASAADDTPATAGDLCKQIGMTLVSTVGGASGPLYGTFFLRFGASAGDSRELDLPSFAAALRAGVDGIVARGKAESNDKTMVDALTPAVEALEARRASKLGEALLSAAEAAERGRDATVSMVARKGRASYLAERSVGHQDPGATSAALLLRAAAITLG